MGEWSGASWQESWWACGAGGGGEWEAGAKVGREVTREHGKRIQQMQGAWKTCPGAIKVDGTAGGWLVSWRWGTVGPVEGCRCTRSRRDMILCVNMPRGDLVLLGVGGQVVKLERWLDWQGGFLGGVLSRRS